MTDIIPDPPSAMMRRLRFRKRPDGAELRSMWASVVVATKRPPRTLYTELGRVLLQAGDPVMAYDVFVAGLRCWPEHLRLRQLQGLALAQCGALKRAQQILVPLAAADDADEETIGILARTWKDLAMLSGDSVDRHRDLQRSYRLYVRAFRRAQERRNLDGMIYTSINVASTALMLGRRRPARVMAMEACSLARNRLRRGRDYWAAATLGEAALVLGNLADAEKHYTFASVIGRGRYRELSSTRCQARRLLARLGEDSNALDRCFEIPNIVTFVGHMIDQPGRPNPRFPTGLEGKVRSTLARRLTSLRHKIGYSSAACGSDILFLEEMQRQRAEYWVVLPFSSADFLKTSVDIVPGWRHRFGEVLAGAAGVVTASEQRSTGSAVVYEYASLLQDGMAALRAHSLDADVRLLAVWDGRRGDGRGGTAWRVKRWRSQGMTPEIIDLQEIRARSVILLNRQQPVSRLHPPRLRSVVRNRDPQRIMALLFADVVHYTGIREEVIPAFVGSFLGGVAQLMRDSSIRPAYANEWGDSFYMAFSTVEEAGGFALELNDWVMAKGPERATSGLPADLNLRIGLHAGPVYRCRDPLTKLFKYTGWHVTRAARIEPIVPPGHVYSSESFAALAAVRCTRSFVCEYAGHVPLAKSSGVSRVYHLRWVDQEAKRKWKDSLRQKRR